MLAPGQLRAQAGSGASMDSTVTITNPGKLSKLQDLEFGSIVTGTAGGTLTVKPDGTTTTTGTLTPVGGEYPAAFNMQRRIFVDYPTYAAPKVSDSIVLTSTTDPSATMLVTNFTTDFNRTVRVGFFRLPAYYFSTNYVFKIGATVHVAANQKPGTYRGQFVVVVDYQ